MNGTLAQPTELYPMFLSGTLGRPMGTEVRQPHRSEIMGRVAEPRKDMKRSVEGLKVNAVEWMTSSVFRSAFIRTHGRRRLNSRLEGRGDAERVYEKTTTG